MKFDVAGARRAGYSDDEIAEFLAQERSFDLGGARSSGYSTSEVLDFLTGQPTPGAGAGRGSINPPMAGQPQPAYPRAAAPAAEPIDYSQAAGDMMGTPASAPVSRSVLDQPSTVPQTPGFDSMLSQDYVASVRRDIIGKAAPENRMSLLTTLAENRTDVLGRAARQILAEAQDENKRISLDQESRAQRLLDAPRGPGKLPLATGGEAPAPLPIAIPDVTPGMFDAVDGRSAKQIAQRRMLAQGVRDADAGIRADVANAEVKRLQVDRSRTVGEYVDDLGVRLQQGGIMARQVIANTIDPSSAWATELAQKMKAAEAEVSAPEQYRAQQFAAKLAEKPSEWAKGAVMLAEFLTNPTLAVEEIVRQGPILGAMIASTVVGGGLGGLAVRGVMAAAPRVALADAISGGVVTAAARGAGATAAARVGSAVGAGGSAAGQVYEELTSKKNESLMEANPDVKRLMAEGKTFEEARSEVALTKARLAQGIAATGGAIFGAAGFEGLLAKKIAGQAATGSAQRAAAIELATELADELTTQGATNFAIGQVDSKRELTQDFGQTAATTLVTSAPLAGASAYLASRKQEPAADPTADAYARAQLSTVSPSEEFISPTQTARSAVDMGPSAPPRTDAGLVGRTINFTPPDSITAQAGLAPIVVPTGQQSGEVNGGLPDVLGGVAGGSGVSGGGDPLAGLGGAGRDPALAAGGGVDAGGALAGLGGVELPGVGAPQPGPSLRAGRGERASDANLLSRAEQAAGLTPASDPAGAPDEIWAGRAGDGYAQPEDAQQALPKLQNRYPDLGWTLQQSSSGRFYWSGRTTLGDASGTAITGAAGQGLAGGTGTDPAQQPRAAGAGLVDLGTNGVGQPGLPRGAATVGGDAPDAPVLRLKLAPPAPLQAVGRAITLLKTSRGVDVELQAGNLSDQQKVASAMARLVGKTVTYMNYVAGPATAMPNGFVVDGQDKNIYLDSNSEDGALFVMMHEGVHALPQPIREKLVTTLKGLTKGEMRGDFAEKFGYDANNEYLVDNEIAAFMTQAVTKRQDFWQELRTKMGDGDFVEVAKVILDKLDTFLTGAKKEYGDEFLQRYATDAVAVRDAVSTAYADAMKAQGQSVPGATTAAPAIAASNRSRLDLNFKDVIKRTPELQVAAEQVKAGEMTAAQYDALVNEAKPVEPYRSVPSPATDNEIRTALKSDQLERIGTPSRTLKAGDPVGLRLDIPAYSTSGTWVVSVHEQGAGYNAGKSIGYEPVASATGVTFGVVEKAAMNIAAGKPKATIAVIKGGWKPTTPAEAKLKADQALKSKAWVQVGMDPERHSYFYDRASMEPVTAADEVIQIGPLVLAKNPTYGAKSDFMFSNRVQEPEIGARLRERIEGDYEGAVQEYAALKGAKGGRLLDADIARELSPEYRAARSRAPEVHEAVSDFIQRTFEARMAQPGEGEIVAFMAGGGGAGKSSAEELLAPVLDRASTVMDGTLSSYDKAERNITMALDSGRKVAIAYVYREPVDALVNGVLTRAKRTGRAVPLDALVKGHSGSSSVVRKLQEKFGSNPNFRLHVIDNSRGAGNAAITTIDNITPVTIQGLRERFINATEQQYQAGQIDDRLYRATTGRQADDGAGAQGAARVGAVQQGSGSDLREGRQPGGSSDQVSQVGGAVSFEGNPDVVPPQQISAGGIQFSLRRVEDINDAPEITMQDLVGETVFPVLADLTAAGYVYMGKELRGGPYYTLLPSNSEAGLIWANDGKGVASIKNKKAKRGVIGLIVAMKQDSHATNNTVANLIFRAVEDEIQKGSVRQEDIPKLDEMVRNLAARTETKKRKVDGKTVNVTRPVFPGFADFPGFSDREASERFLRKMPFEARGLFFEEMTKGPVQDMGLGAVRKVIAETVEPDLRGLNMGDVVMAIRFDPNEEPVTLGKETGTPEHDSYRYAVKGTVIGKFKRPMSFQNVFVDLMAERAAKGTNIKRDYRSLTLRKPEQRITQEIADKVTQTGYKSIASPAEAQAATAAANIDWKKLDRPAAAGVREFLRTRRVMSEGDVPSFIEAKALIKSGKLRIFRLAETENWFSLEERGADRVMTSVMVMQPGVRQETLFGDMIEVARANGATHVEVGGVVAPMAKVSAPKRVAPIMRELDAMTDNDLVNLGIDPAEVRRLSSVLQSEDAVQASPTSVLVASNRISPADKIKWREVSDVKAEIALDKLPAHIIPFADFMQTMATKASNGALTSRDVIKAYTIARSSMNRGAVETGKIKAAGLGLPATFTDAKIRPEGAFGYWLLSPVGQRYLNAAEIGLVDQPAIDDAVKVMTPFGTQNALGEDLKRAAQGDLHTRLPALSAAIKKAAEGGDAVQDWQDALDNLYGVREAKKGFLGSLLGFGQLPTFDARQINVNVDRESKEDTLRALSSTRAREVVATLARRMDALSLTMDPKYAPFYRHLAHHAVWDSVGNTETTHADVVESMLTASNRALPKASPQSALETDIGVASRNLEQAIARVKAGRDIPGRLVIGRLPHVLNMLGARTQDFEITSSIVKKVFVEKHQEDFGGVSVRDFVRAMYQPAMVLKSKDGVAREFELVLSITGEKGAVIVPIKVSVDKSDPLGAVMSAYQKEVSTANSPKEMTVMKRINDGNLLYVDPGLAKQALTGRKRGEKDGVKLNENFVSWASVWLKLEKMIIERRVKTDVSLARWIGDNYKPSSSPDGWQDAPSFSNRVREDEAPVSIIVGGRTLRVPDSAGAVEKLDAKINRYSELLKCLQ